MSGAIRGGLWRAICVIFYFMRRYRSVVGMTILSLLAYKIRYIH